MSKPLDRELLDQVLIHYVSTGNASEAGRRVGIDVRTARKVVERARKGEDVQGAEILRELTEQGRQLRAGTLESLELMIRDAAEVAHMGISHNHDASPQLMRALADFHRTLTNAQRLHAERAGELGGPAQRPEVRVVLASEAKVEDEKHAR